MNASDAASPHCRRLRVLPQARGSWIVATEQEEVLSEHPTATEAQNAALARLGDGDELLVVDRYHSCHRLTRSGLTRSSSRFRISHER